MPGYSDILDGFMAEARDFIDNPARLDRLLLEAEDLLRQIPSVGETLSGLPVMIAMVKSWIRQEYAVQPRTLLTIVAALLYLLKRNDLISDSIPVLGLTDDAAVLMAALRFVEPELNEYRAWRDS